MKQVVAKSIGRQGSTVGNRVTYQVTGTETLTGTDWDFTFDYGTGPVSVTFIPRLISQIVNCGGSNVTIDGQTYGPGTWDFSETGGPILSSSTSVAVTGTHVIIEFRS